MGSREDDNTLLEPCAAENTGRPTPCCHLASRPATLILVRVDVMLDRLPPVTYELSLSEPAGEPWQVTRIWVAESLNRPYRAVIDAATEAENHDTDSLLGCSATLTFTRGESNTRAVYGLVTRVDFLGYQDHQLMVRLHVAPALELLRQRVNSRIWQARSVQDILGDVLESALGDYERSFDLASIRRGTSSRDYCVQYRESDFDFVSRLLEAEGISYEFVHDTEAGAETLTLRDANDQYTELANIDGTSDVPIIASNPDEAHVESIQMFEWSKQLSPTAALRRDFDWRTPRQPLSATAAGTDERGRERRVFSHGRRRLSTDDLAQQSGDLQLASRLTTQLVHGRSNVSAMRPGLRFKIHGHDRPDLEREYLITEVVHTGSESQIADAQASGYTNEFECVPIDAIVRPQSVTPQPREYGSQTAIVVGPEGEEIHTDEHGRVQVQFYWQEQPSYLADASCWVRCSQSWAGMSWGAQFIPRIGMEVVVEFLEGNPDRPLVTGCVYNAEFTPPFALPEHKTQSGWKTNSSPGGGGANELRFEDAAGSEEIYIHGQKDWTIEIENDNAQTIGHDERLEVGHDRTHNVGHDERFEIGNDQTGQIGNNHSLSVGGNQQSVIGAERTDTIGLNAIETVGASKTVMVGQMLTQTVGTSMATIVAETSTLGIGGDSVVTVGENASESVVGDKTVEAANITFKLKGQSTYETGKDMGFVSGKKITVKGDKEVIVESDKKMTFKCGDASITLSSDGKIMIKGKDVTVKGSGNVVVKGQKFAGN
jgi:type VI secretion system secreted protein VgrG